MQTEILNHRHPTVRRQADPVDHAFLTSAQGQALIELMLTTMHRANGIGLAASQIGQPLRLAVIAFKDGDLVMANPTIIRQARKTLTEEEGCLSVPGVFGLVKRPAWVIVRYENEHGQPRQTKASGLFGRVVQHEIDHLNGVVYIEKARQLTRGQPSG